MDEKTREAIKSLTQLSYQEELVDDFRIESVSGGVEGLIQGNNKTILVKLLSAETEIEQETIYSLFLRILDKNSHKGIIICHALVGEKVANLAELYDIQIIVLEKPAEMERSIRETLYQVFR